MSTLYSTRVTAIGGRSGTIRSEDGLLAGRQPQRERDMGLAGAAPACTRGLGFASHTLLQVGIMLIGLRTSLARKLQNWVRPRFAP